MIDVTSADVTVATPWMGIAWQEYGIGPTEVAGPVANRRIKLYLSMCNQLPEEMKNDDQTAWCGALMTYVMHTAGYVPPAFSARARAWSTWGKPGPMAYGAVIVLQRPEAGQGAGHVGLYLERVSSTQITLLSGNSANTIRKSNYPLAQIINGPRWPENAIV